MKSSAKTDPTRSVIAPLPCRLPCRLLGRLLGRLFELLGGIFFPLFWVFWAETTWVDGLQPGLSVLTGIVVAAYCLNLLKPGFFLAPLLNGAAFVSATWGLAMSAFGMVALIAITHPIALLFLTPFLTAWSYRAGARRAAHDWQDRPRAQKLGAIVFAILVFVLPFVLIKHTIIVS